MRCINTYLYVTVKDECQRVLINNAFDIYSSYFKSEIIRLGSTRQTLLQNRFDFDLVCIYFRAAERRLSLELYIYITVLPGGVFCFTFCARVQNGLSTQFQYVSFSNVRISLTFLLYSLSDMNGFKK